MYVLSSVLRRQTFERLASCLSRRNLSYGPTRAITSKILTPELHKLHQNQQRMPRNAISGPLTYRFYCSKPPSRFDSGSASLDTDDEWSDDWSSDDDFYDAKSHLPASSLVPEVFPVVPLIAVKYPIFPKFSKIIEVTDPKLIQRLEWSVANNTPYAGVFVLKDSESQVTTVTDINQVHSVGTFIKIGEIERRENKMQLIATGHRRIKLVRPIERPNLDVFIKENIAKANPIAEQEKEKENEKVKDKVPIQVVETENLPTRKIDTQSTEYKAMTLEMVATIRKIINENPFIQEAVKNMLGENLHVAESPAYLVDLAAAITSARPTELQMVLEEQDVMCKHS